MNRARWDSRGTKANIEIRAIEEELDRQVHRLTRVEESIFVYS